jgi:hypothetical protein
MYRDATPGSIPNKYPRPEGATESSGVGEPPTDVPLCLVRFWLRSSYWKYRLISEPIHFPTGTETPFPIIR